MGGRTIRKHVMSGDWPTDKSVAHDRRENHQLSEAAGVGPRLTDDMCEACGTRIYATGECRCS